MALDIVITSIDEITTTSCKIHYTANKHQSAWYAGDVIETPDDGTDAWSGSLYWVTLTGLESGTDYSVYIRGKEYNYSDWENSNIDNFTTTGVLPGKPTNPSPADDVTNITLDETPLSWDASDPAADTYEIYFREQGNNWELVGGAQTGIEWVIPFGTLDYETTYEWRIDATNAYGTTTGDTWIFTTITFNPPIGQGAADSDFTVKKRLVAAVANKFFYEDI